MCEIGVINESSHYFNASRDFRVHLDNTSRVNEASDVDEMKLRYEKTE